MNKEQEETLYPDRFDSVTLSCSLIFLLSYIFLPGNPNRIYNLYSLFLFMIILIIKKITEFYKKK